MTSPQEFDFADWFGDIGVPEESVDVFTRADLVGEIQNLQRRIEEHDAAQQVERSLSDEMSDEEARLAELLEEFNAGRVTFYLRGLTQDERNEIREAHEEAGERNEAFALRCVAKSIVGVRRFGKDRVKATMSLPHVTKLHHQLGEGQMAKLFQAYQQATNGVPFVDADFLLRRSGQGDIEE